MSPGPAIPTIDVAEAERRLREDPASPLLVDVREANEFEDVRAPGAVLVPMSARAAGISYEDLCVQLLASASLDHLKGAVRK